MILLVPYMPEVPKAYAPKLWQALTVVLILSITYVKASSTIVSDRQYIDAIVPLIQTNAQGQPLIDEKANNYIRLRPLLRISPSKGDWDFRRLFFANFLHGSSPHLILNLVGVFVGVGVGVWVGLAVGVQVGVAVGV